MLPAASTVDDVLATGADGVFLSNGPGDPATADCAVALTAELLRRRVPLFGICFGNQVLGRALGLGTYKLRFGHRGINQPVQDRATGKVEVTAHNHGFAVDAPTRRRRSTRRTAGRGLATSASTTTWSRGCAAATCRRFSVQYHPEAAAGPHDAAYLFDRFAELLDAEGRLMPRRTDISQRPGHRLRADRHRAGLRVRLLRHPGLPGAARGGPAGRPGQLQPGDDHDRPGVRRRDLHRADHARDRRGRSSRRSAPTRCSRPSAARPR